MLTNIGESSQHAGNEELAPPEVLTHGYSTDEDRGYAHEKAEAAGGSDVQNSTSTDQSISGDIAAPIRKRQTHGERRQRQLVKQKEVTDELTKLRFKNLQLQATVENRGISSNDAFWYTISETRTKLMEAMRSW